MWPANSIEYQYQMHLFSQGTATLLCTLWQYYSANEKVTERKWHAPSRNQTWVDRLTVQRSTYLAN